MCEPGNPQKVWASPPICKYFCRNPNPGTFGLDAKLLAFVVAHQKYSSFSGKEIIKRTNKHTTSFPGSLFFPPQLSLSLSRWGGKKRDPGNKVDKHTAPIKSLSPSVDSHHQIGFTCRRVFHQYTLVAGFHRCLQP